MTRKKFLYNLSRSSFEKNGGATYQRPGVKSRVEVYRGDRVKGDM